MRRLRLAAAVAGAWTLYAVFAASQNYIGSYGSPMVSWNRAFSYSLTDAWPWALLTAVAFPVAGKLLVRRRNWWWAVPLLFLSGLLLGALPLEIFICILH